jgi:hypothetical protein
MSRLVVLFDANAYISLPQKEVAGLVVRERSNGVVAWASYFVVEELLARCAADDERRAGGGVAALRRLSEHCQMYDGSHERINFLADPRQQAAQILYGKGRFHDQRTIDTYGTVVKTIATKPRADWPQATRDAIQSVRAEIEQGETTFAKAMFDDVVARLVPEAKDWADIRRDPARADALAEQLLSGEALDLCATLFAEELAAMIDLDASPEQLERASVTLKEGFQIPLRLYNALMYAVVKNGQDVSRPEVANTIWDMQLAMSIPTSSRIFGKPVWIVTDDGAFHKAAKTAGLTHVVHDLASYLELTRDGAALRAKIDLFFQPLVALSK